MAGDVKAAVVSGALSTSPTGTLDLTKTDFGTPKAAILILTFDPSDDAGVAGESKLCIVLTDFTNKFSIIHQDKDASAKADCDAQKGTINGYTTLDVAGGFDIRGQITTITDGVRLTNNTNASGTAPFVTAIMFGGADLADDLRSTVINSSQDGTATISHSGLTDGNEKLIFFIGTDVAAENNSNTGINNSFGVCHVTGNDAGGYTFTQRCIGWTSDHNNTAGSPSAILSTDRVLDIITEAGGQDWGLEVTDFSNSGGTITVTTRDNGAGAGMEVYSLIVDLDDRKAKVGSVDGPTSGTTFSITGMGFKPQFNGLLLTDLTNEDIISSDAEAGVLGISSNTGSGEETCHSWYNEDAIGTTNTNNLFRSRAIDLRDDDVTTVLQDHSHSSFDSGGVTHTINIENETVAKKWGFWAIEEATVAGGATIAVPLATISFTNQVPAVASGKNVAVPLATEAITDFVPKVGTSALVTVPLATISEANFAPAVASGKSVIVPLATLNLADLIPAVGTSALVAVPLNTLTLNDLVPAVASGKSVIVPLDSISIAEFVPTIDAVGGVAAAKASMIPMYRRRRRSG